MSLKIAGLQKVTLLDYPGHIAATVFLAGCNLDCGYCHNRWMLQPAQVQEALPVGEFLRWLGTRVGKLDGVCVSGGEPLLHDDLDDLLRAIRPLRVKLDTNGTQPAHLERLLTAGLVDYVALDLKAPLDERYDAVAGRVVDVAAICQSMGLLRGWGGAYEYRTTVLPGFDEATLRAIARDLLPREAWYWQRFVPAAGVDATLCAQPRPDEEALRGLAARMTPPAMCRF